MTHTALSAQLLVVKLATYATSVTTSNPLLLSRHELVSYSSGHK